MMVPSSPGQDGQIVVVKLGGNAIGDAEMLQAWAQDVNELQSQGFSVVVTHGGGPQINIMLERLGIPSEFIGGFRYTSTAALEVVRMVLVGKVQREIVAALQGHGVPAVGLCGEDGPIFRATRRTQLSNGDPVDLGLVGNVSETSTGAVEALLHNGFVPVVSGLGATADGQGLNLNADSAAAALATGLQAQQLILMTDIESLFADWPHNIEPIVSLDLTELDAILPTLSDGMIPKMEACRDAVAAGVGSARVIDGRPTHGLRNAMSNKQLGTTVLAHG